MDRRKAIPIGLGLVLAATAAAYLPSIDGPFLLDDVALPGDPLVVDPLGQDAAAWLASPRPLAELTFALNHAAVGLDPRGWHLTNLAIHLAAVLLAFLLARALLRRARLSSPDLPALAAAALFALHPLQTESVAYLTQRAEALASALCALAFLLLLARDREGRPRRRLALLAAAALLQALALAVKPIAATLPLAWLLAAVLLPLPEEDALPAWRRAARRLPAALPLLALSALAALRGLGGAEGSVHAGFGVPRLSPAAYLATQLRVIPTYLRLLAWPADQCGDWAFPASAGFGEPAVIAGGALLLGLCAAAVLAARRARGREGDGPAALRAAAFGALFFLVALAPSSSLVPLLDPLAEHRVYLACLGLFLALAAGAAVALRRLVPGRAAVAGAALAAAAGVALGVATARRSEVWASSLAFWADAAEKAPGKARVHMNLGQALYDDHRPAEALAQFQRARDLRGDHTISGDTLLANLVGTYLSLGRLDEARGEVERALSRFPRQALGQALLANVEYVSGDDEAAEAAALRGLQGDPRQGIALKFLGMARARRGDLAGALGPLRAAAAAHPVDPMLFWELGAVEERTGGMDAACAAYLEAAEQPLNATVSARAREAAGRLGCR